MNGTEKKLPKDKNNNLIKVEKEPYKDKNNNLKKIQIP